MNTSITKSRDQDRDRDQNINGNGTGTNHRDQKCLRPGPGPIIGTRIDRDRNRDWSRSQSRDFLWVPHKLFLKIEYTHTMLWRWSAHILNMGDTQTVFSTWGNHTECNWKQRRLWVPALKRGDAKRAKFRIRGHPKRAGFKIKNICKFSPQFFFKFGQFLCPISVQKALEIGTPSL